MAACGNDPCNTALGREAADLHPSPGTELATGVACPPWARVHGGVGSGDVLRLLEVLP